MSDYSQGVCQDGAAILKDGGMMTVEEILKELRDGEKLYKDFHGCCDVQLDSFRKIGITEGLKYCLKVAEQMVGDPVEDDLQKFIYHISKEVRPGGNKTAAPDVIGRARSRGAIDFVKGVKVGDNPFSEHDARHWAWIQGWSTAGLEKC